MKKNNLSVDGIMLKKSSNRLGGLDDNVRKPKPKLSGAADNNTIDQNLLNELSSQQETTLGHQEGQDLTRLDIDESLQNIESQAEPTDKKLSRRQLRKLDKKLGKKAKKPHSKAYKIIRSVIILIVIAAILAGAYMGYKLINVSNSVFKGNILQIFQNVELKQDANGRSNFLILGTSEDDPGHEAAYLTDSIIVLSVDQHNHNAYMFSVPRDLYVEYGEACVAGYSGKVNVYFSCANDGDTDADEQDRLEKTQKLIGGIFGLDIQYSAHVNYTVLKQAVDAVDGIDVDVQGSNGDSGVLDRNFDAICNYTCYMVKYDNGVHHLDGIHALYLAQARGHSAPTYGLSRSNFDREVNQQKIIIALKEKAISTGTLTDFSKVTKLIDSLGNNLRTNVQTKEIRTLIDIATKTKSSDVHRLSLVGDDGSASLLTTGGGNVIPIAGETDYSAIQAYLTQSLSSNPLVRENAPIVVLNGTGQSGYGQTKASELEDAGYNVSLVDTAPDGTYDAVEVYQIGTESTQTATALQKLYGVKIKTTTPPVAVADGVEFVVVFGSTASSKTTSE